MIRDGRDRIAVELAWPARHAACAHRVPDGCAPGGPSRTLGWRGVITQLRLDPCSAKDATVAIEWIALLPAKD